MSKFAFLVLALLAGCTNESGATRALQGAGYTHIKLTGYRWLSCGKDDTYADGFEAIGPTGGKVSGTVCAGLMFKGSTIRLD